MSVETLNGLLSTKDALAFHDPERQLPSSLPITKSLLQSCRSAYTTYRARIEREKEKIRQDQAEKAEEQEKKRKQKRLEEEHAAESKDRKAKESKLNKEEATAQDDLKIGNAIIAEANTKLANAIQKKDMQQVSVAQMMLEQGQKKIMDTTKHLESIGEQRKKLARGSFSASDQHKDKKQKNTTNTVMNQSNSFTAFAVTSILTELA